MEMKPLKGQGMKAAGYAFTGSWTWGENISIRWGGGVGATYSKLAGYIGDRLSVSRRWASQQRRAYPTHGD